MRLYKTIILSLFISLLVSCAITIQGTRILPKHHGVDPQIGPYVDEWLSLAKLYKIKFNRSVDIGFDDIDQGDVVGLTNYGFGFREVDIDRSYWNRATSIEKTILVFHELGHAYCNREHGYGKDGKYDKNLIAVGQGYFTDLCPISIMFPYVLEDDCFTAHYQEYLDELFQNCDPY